MDKERCKRRSKRTQYLALNLTFARRMLRSAVLDGGRRALARIRRRHRLFPLNCVSNKTRSSLVPMKKCIPRPVLRSTVNYQNKTIDAKLCRSADFTSAKGH